MCDACVIESNLKCMDKAITLQYQRATVFRCAADRGQNECRLIEYVLQRHCYACYSIVTIDAPCDLAHFHVLREP